MLRAFGIAFLLLETALSQTTAPSPSSKVAGAQMGESSAANRPEAPGTINGVVTDSSG